MFMHWQVCEFILPLYGVEYMDFVPIEFMFIQIKGEIMPHLTIAIDDMINGL